MERKEWHKVLERYVNESLMTSEEYVQLDDYQKFTIQELKKLFKRIQQNEQKLFNL